MSQPEIDVSFVVAARKMTRTPDGLNITVTPTRRAGRYHVRVTNADAATRLTQQKTLTKPAETTTN